MVKHKKLGTITYAQAIALDAIDNLSSLLAFALGCDRGVVTVDSAAGRALIAEGFGAESSAGSKYVHLTSTGIMLRDELTVQLGADYPDQPDEPEPVSDEPTQPVPVPPAACSSCGATAALLRGALGVCGDCETAIASNPSHPSHALIPEDVVESMRRQRG